MRPAQPTDRCVCRHMLGKHSPTGCGDLDCAVHRAGKCTAAGCDCTGYRDAEAMRQRFVELHGMLDELLAAFLHHTGKRPGTATIGELIAWSHEQTRKIVHPS